MKQGIKAFQKNVVHCIKHANCGVIHTRLQIKISCIYFFEETRGCFRLNYTRHKDYAALYCLKNIDYRQKYRFNSDLLYSKKCKGVSFSSPEVCL